MNGYAEAYQVAGRLKEALALHDETLKLRQKTLGLDDADTLKSMNNLAVAYQSDGRTDEVHRGTPTRLRGSRGWQLTGWNDRTQGANRGGGEEG